MAGSNSSPHAARRFLMFRVDKGSQWSTCFDRH